MIKTLSQETYLTFFQNDPYLRELLTLINGLPEAKIGISTYFKLVLFENKPSFVALKEVIHLLNLYNLEDKKSIINSYCEVCECDPCDCYDYYWSSNE